MTWHLSLEFIPLTLMADNQLLYVGEEICVDEGDLSPVVENDFVVGPFRECHQTVKSLD
jgi:hypothetical protein